jgi:hypothetical protein
MIDRSLVVHFDSAINVWLLNLDLFGGAEY